MLIDGRDREPAGWALKRSLPGRAWSHVFAALYDPLNRDAEEHGGARRRAELLAEARGDVVEVGAGTGVNLVHYPESLRSLTLVEPDPAMRKRLVARLASRHARVVAAPAERLPLADRSADTVVFTYVLCGVDTAAALAEARRVLRPGGRMLFIEHVRSREPRLARWQDRLNRPWRALACGCNCNRDTEGALRDGGFSLVRLERAQPEKELALVRPTIWGSAVP